MKLASETEIIHIKKIIQSVLNLKHLLVLQDVKIALDLLYRIYYFYKYNININ